VNLPIENELKFVVRLDDKLEEEAKQLGNCLKIRQGYIAEDRKTKITVRLREITYPSGQIKMFLQTKCKTFNFPKSVDKSTIIEVGTEIDTSDFNRLWKLATCKLTKSRYCIDVGTAKSKETWELDFFKTKNNLNYFILAEIELPEASDEWHYPMPKLIEGNVVYYVPWNDNRFSNRKLGNIKYATKLYNSVYIRNFVYD